MEEVVDVVKPEKDEYLPTIWGAAKLLLGYVFLTTIPYAVMAIFYAVRGLPDDPVLKSGISSIVGLFFLVLWIRRKHLLEIRDQFLTSTINAKYFPPVVLLIVGTNIVLSELDNLLKMVWPMSQFWASLLGELVGGRTGLWKSILTVVIIASVVEEILFRGIILRGLLKHYSVNKAIFASALMFAIFHMNPWQFMPALVLGLIMGWWYVKTSSLVMCVFIHSLNNSLGFITTHLLRVRIPGYNAAGTSHPLWFNALGVCLVAAGVYVLYSMFKGRLAAEQSFTSL